MEASKRTIKLDQHLVGTVTWSNVLSYLLHNSLYFMLLLIHNISGGNIVLLLHIVYLKTLVLVH